MQKMFRSFAAALAMAGLVLSLASPALAVERLAVVENDPSAMPMMFDILVMRPIGLAATLVGTAVYVFPVLPIMAVTRPSDIAEPLEPLVAAPGRFTFSDPIGQHP